MQYHIITLFPELFDSFTKTSLIARAIKKRIITVTLHNLRDYALDKHKTVDERPYGGGPGMVLKVDVMDRAIQAVKKKCKGKTNIILLTPQGKQFSTKLAQKLSSFDSLVLIAGHYEGFDERIRSLVNEEISIGDYVLTGGELPAQVMIDAVSRQVAGFFQKPEAIVEESFGKGGEILEYPHYTRPETYGKKTVPKILLSGDHKKINEWRKDQALKRTHKRRPDLLS